MIEKKYYIQVLEDIGPFVSLNTKLGPYEDEKKFNLKARQLLTDNERMSFFEIYTEENELWLTLLERF